MNDFSSYIGIIGGGISGLTLGCTLKKYRINTIIFEKEQHLHDEGAGISISPNGLLALERLELKNELEKNSYKSSKALLKYNNSPLLEMDSPVYTMNRRNLINILYKKYIDLGGEILFEYELQDLDIEKKECLFTNSSLRKIRHVIASDGIKSLVREKFFSEGSQPIYSGYSAWRGTTESDNPNVEISFSSNKHLVSYPINSDLKRSFTGIIKTNEQINESWREKGNLETLAKNNDLSFKEYISFGKDYAKTLAIWKKNFFLNWRNIEKLGFDENFKRLWEYYLTYCEVGFKNGSINVGQYLLERNNINYEKK